MCAKVITNQGKVQEKLTEKHRRLWIFAISRGDTATEISQDCGELLSPKTLGKLHPPGSDTMLPGSLLKKNLGRKKYRDWDESKEQKEGRGPKARQNATCGPRNSRVWRLDRAGLLTPKAARRHDNAAGYRVRDLPYTEVRNVPVHSEMAPRNFH
ncbi:hypothetical protein Bbelb_059800 [Branchiostoma belcheri]|nr:hypothetical protein Bbelb_059800 [Branchiostoma belcheri]